MGRPSLSRLALLLVGSIASVVVVPSARAQRVVPKLQVVCPMGYVDTFNGKCSTLGLMTYTVTPTRGKACLEGWMNVGGGYCRRK
ncbi:MAG: hypothetical protein NTZ53_04635 [Cyanobacteria bacterium]|nr:hypothetical protein [Cyanobacteriota bacterium]